jgi:hypothetical protein
MVWAVAVFDEPVSDVALVEQALMAPAASSTAADAVISQGERIKSSIAKTDLNETRARAFWFPVPGTSSPPQQA